MNFRSITIRSVLLGALFASVAVFPDAAYASEGYDPNGSLFRAVVGDNLEKNYGIKVHGWTQFGLIYNDNGSDDVSKQGVFNTEEGFNLNQIGLVVERAAKGNVVGRVGPFPGPMPKEADWGFNVTTIYGKDARFFKTYGFDEDFGINRSADADDENLNIAQAYLEFFFPVLGGSNLMLGVFHTPLENEIGFALDAPVAAFYTHPYSFAHGPAKHVGALYSLKLPQAEGDSMLGLEFGVVRGWNNMQDPNDDFDVIANVRWRSADFRTWVDWENIYGNGAGDSFADCGCGSQFPAGNADDNLPRFSTYLTVSHTLDAKDTLVGEFSYGSQEDAAFAGFANEKNAHWYGSNFSWLHTINENLAWNSRAEWFRTDAPAHVMLANIDAKTGIPDPSWGSFYGFTTNLAWKPVPNLRLRTEVRYDIHDGSGRDAFNGGNDDSQLIGAIDATVWF